MKILNYEQLNYVEINCISPGGQFLSSELSPQSLPPSHMYEDGIHFLRLAHLNSVEEHCTKMEEKGYMHYIQMISIVSLNNRSAKI